MDGGRYGELARGGGISGAEWSLFWPGIGIAVDSCAALSVRLDRPAVGAALEASAGTSTDVAEGTDGSATDPTVDPTVDPDTLGAGGSDGIGGIVGVLSQAPSHRTQAPSATAGHDKGVRFDGRAMSFTAALPSACRRIR